MIAAIRSAIFLTIMAVTVIPYAFLCLLCAPLPLSFRYRFTAQWPRAMIHAARLICGVRWEVKGWENLPDAPAVILCKHQSTWETFWLVCTMPRELCFVFKRELLYVPFFGWGIGLLDMIHINRKQGKNAFESVVAQGSQKLADGRWISMFPEGTRIPSGEKGNYKSGGARLAMRTNAVIIPIAVNSGRLWPKKSFIKRPGLITVSIGPAISPTNQTPDQLTTAVETWIEGEMRKISPGDYGNLPSSTAGQGAGL